MEQTTPRHFIIGSHALRKFFPDFKREPFDLDVVIRSEDDRQPLREKYKDYPRVEFHVFPLLYDYMYKHGSGPNLLLTLKASHIMWPIKWDKTLFDINFLFDHGAKVIEPLFYELVAHWTEKYGFEHRSNLDQPAKEFFDNALKTYDHEELHHLLNPNPTFYQVLKDGAEVDVDGEKFKMLTYQQKCDLVREEVYVMAFERRGKMGYGGAYYKMFKQFIMKHAPVWEVLFIIENYNHLYRAEFDYFKFFEEALKTKQNGKKENDLRPVLGTV